LRIEIVRSVFSLIIYSKVYYNELAL